MIAIRNAFISGVLFGIIVAIYLLYENKSNDFILVVSIFCTITFSVISYFKMFSKVDYKTKFDTVEKQSIIYSGLANREKDGIAVGGNLYLSKDNLVFQTNAINFLKRHEHKVILSEIKKVEIEPGLISSEMFLSLQNGVVEKFTVNKGETWKQQLDNLLLN